jgi:hypothetical protein
VKEREDGLRGTTIIILGGCEVRGGQAPATLLPAPSKIILLAPSRKT